MGDRNLDIALRIKADLGSARTGLDRFIQTLGTTGKQADSTNNALGRSGQRIDALLASTQQMVKLLQSMDARLASMAEGSLQVARATEQVSAGTEAAATSVRKLAETEDEAATRIRAVIAASREHTAAMTEGTRATQDATTATDRQGRSVDNVAEAVARQNAQTRRWSTATAEAAAAERKAGDAAQVHAADLSRLLGQIDPTIAALERLDQQEADLQKYRKLGLLDTESFQRFQKQIEVSRQAVGRMGISAGQTAQAMRQLPAQITDVTVSLAAGMPVWLVFLQQGSQIKDSFGGIGPAIRGVLSLLTPMRVALGGLVGVLGLLAVAMVTGYRENEQLARSIISTGNYAGETTGEVDQLAASLSAVNGRFGETRDIINGLIGSGRIAGDALNSVGRAAVNMAALSGKSAQEVVSEWTKVADDPVRAALQLDQQYHFLNTTLFQQIQTLQQAGNQYEALKLVASAFADDTGRKMDELHRRMGWLETFADRWSRGFDSLKTGLLDLGKPATEIDKFQQALANYNKVYDVYLRSRTAGSSKEYQDTLFARSQQAYKELQAAQAAAKEAQSNAAAEGINKQVQADGVAAAASIDQLTTSLDRAKQRQEALNKAAADLYKIHLAGGKLPAGINFNGPVADLPQGAGWEKLQAQIEKRYADPKVARISTHSAKTDYSQAISAQQGLIQSLQQLQGQLDPTAAAWAKYNAAVDQANQQAALAKKAPGANAAAIDAERQAVAQLAATIRDGELDKLAERDRQAWEALRQSLRTPAEVSVETALAQIQKLDDLLAKGVITAEQYHGALERIGQRSVTAAPQYQGVDAAVSGVYGEVLKNQQAMQALDDWHAQQMAANETFRAQDAANEEAYQARLAEIERQYADQRARIEQSRQQLTLQASAEFFGQMATLSSSSNSKIARIGRAAAIAKAIIDTYQAANAAYASLASIPYIGPALGAAAAAAAVAAGLANVAAIRSQPTGFATGGAIRGPGTATSDSIPIWASDGEYMQRAAAVDYYGLDFMEAVNNLRLPKRAFADGGPISAPRIQALASPRLSTRDLASRDAEAPRSGGSTKHVHLWDRDQAAQEIASTSSFEEAVLHVVGSNPTTIHSRWGE